MSAIWSFRTAAILLVLFAAGHTVGFLSFTPPTAEGRAVLDAMNKVRFDVNGASFTYGGFYKGFGLFVTAYLLFSAVLAWQLSGFASRHKDVAAALGWTFCGVQVASLALSWIYFSAAPAIFSGLVAGCLGWAASRVQA